MNIGILNEKLGIMTIDTLDDLGYVQVTRIKKQMPEGATLENLAFFYMADRDWIVINRAHALYEYYSEVIPIYLELSEQSRRECVKTAPGKAIRRAFNMLDGVIRDRALIHRKAV